MRCWAPRSTGCEQSPQRAVPTGRGGRSCGSSVLVLGGGLLHLGDLSREIAEELPPAAAAGYLAQPWLEGTLASCRVESLLHAADPELPLVHGLVDGSAALAYWEAVERAGVTAGPLHMLGHTVRAG
ncbi:hypothetical protein [Streptomyces sp. V1I1]|uniref:hypothetical protein n=1 Tax=Streptomyces sp. V1I1 TaxID=3042272 RepID=UPI0027847EDA|nr:hypothetical protein [Streptomyces sp. V1I1]MDQ0945648.1 hypothetical protein [Streptomyces sp. V1I1]